MIYALQAGVSLLAAVVFYTVVCRAAKMSHNTVRSIRWSFAAVGLSAFALGVVPWVRDSTFEMCVLFFVAAIVWAQAATARLWSRGVPHQFQAKRKK